jgi:hypothetical protein
MKEQLKIKDGILALVLVLVLLYFITGNIILAYIAFGLGILSLASRYFATLLYRPFTWLTGLIGKINNVLLLSIIYWIILTPVAFFMKGKSGVKLKKPAGSNFTERNHLFSPDDLKNPW